MRLWPGRQACTSVRASLGTPSLPSARTCSRAWEAPHLLGSASVDSGKAELTPELSNEEEAGGIEHQGSLPPPRPAPPRGRRAAGRPLLSWAIKAGCQPDELAILYGVLRAPADTVLVRAAGGMRSLMRVSIPASLHAHGVLVLLSLPSVPDGLVVRAPSGRLVGEEKLTGFAREARQVCEGEAEGPTDAH